MLLAVVICMFAFFKIQMLSIFLRPPTFIFHMCLSDGVPSALGFDNWLGPVAPLNV